MKTKKRTYIAAFADAVDALGSYWMSEDAGEPDSELRKRSQLYAKEAAELSERNLHEVNREIQAQALIEYYG